MNPRVTPLASLYGSGDELFRRALTGLTREQGLARLDGHTNPLLWIAAHLTTTRYGFAQLIGLDRERPWGKNFTRGSAVGDLSAIPDAAEIRAAWDALCPPLATRLSEITDAELDAPAPRNFPTADKSVLGGMAFLAYHEAYHIGQISLIRKSLGLGGLVG
jgi:hypothetical protein